jgi:hypothetical protein
VGGGGAAAASVCSVLPEEGSWAVTNSQKSVPKYIYSECRRKHLFEVLPGSPWARFFSFSRPRCADSRPCLCDYVLCEGEKEGREKTGGRMGGRPGGMA